LLGARVRHASPFAFASLAALAALAALAPFAAFAAFAARAARAPFGRASLVPPSARAMRSIACAK
jgi:hypothetical protein